MTDTEKHSDVTILGLGAMGSAYTREFLKAGKRVTVWNRTSSKADSLVREGALWAPNVKSAMAASPLTILAVVDHDSIREMLSDDVLAASTNRTLIDLTTGTEAEFKELVARTRDAGMPFLAGGVLAYPRSVGSADTAVFYSGDANVFEENKHLLRHIGGAQHYVSSDPALGVKVVLALALMGFVAVGGFFEAVGWAETCGVSVATMSEYVRTSGLPWMNECIAYLGERISSGSDDGDQATVDVYVDGFKAALSDLQGAGVGSRSVGAIVDYVKTAQKMGLGSKGLSAVYEVVRNNQL
ncbi:3-hydroxyisobutyrate dehydrogenase [Pandoraea terrae]|uniref:3-hydroxyisobutyrate dehydrogenase n=1 Tax=Pandoraea terrae TaxID=1537710 RepID=A0A5E4SKC1_9BURK|nr:NAD(P)-binding domain-containing protein [Pandoraea terrae]VVD75453.1 3-hydroxyisobutyrate dehydrogenase [Pandoraea terrae]